MYVQVKLKNLPFVSLILYFLYFSGQNKNLYFSDVC